MEICATCAAKLDPSWKFCIKCGTPVPAGAARRTRDEPTAAAETAVPATAPSAEPSAQALVASSQDARAKRKPRRARSQFAPPTPAVVDDGPGLHADPHEADTDVDDLIAREPVLPVPVIPAHVDREQAAPAQAAPAQAPAAQTDPAQTHIERTNPEQSPPLPPATTESEPEPDAEPDLDLDLDPDPDLEPAPEPAFAHSPSINDLARSPFSEEENPFSHDLPPRPEQPQSRAEAKAAAAERAATRARTTAAAKAEIRAKYPIPTASSGASLEYTEESGPAFRTIDGVPSRRKIDVPLVVSISLSTAGVILIVYLAILVFGARG